MSDYDYAQKDNEEDFQYRGRLISRAYQLERELEKLRRSDVSRQDQTLWLWNNFVDGKPEYWAFDNPFPTFGGGDPMVLGQPAAYAILKHSTRSPRHPASGDAAEMAKLIKRKRDNSPRSE